MFRKPHYMPSDSSLQFVTPNSRIIPSTPSRDLDTKASEIQPRYQQEFSVKAPGSSPYDTLYDTYGHDSFIEPIQGISPSVGTSRQTFIEPQKSAMAPASLYGSQQFLDHNQNKHHASSFDDIDYFQNTGNRESIHVKRPSIIIEPRVQQVEIPVKIQQANPSYAQASYATIENATYQYHRGGGGDVIDLQPPSTSSPCHHSKSATKHPQQLTPLVIPPTPHRSTSSLLPTNATPMSAQPQQRSPLPSSSQLTPALTPGSLYGSSPRTVSPHTPSSAKQYLASPSPGSHQHQPTAGKKKDTSVPEGEALLLQGIKHHESGQLEQATYYFHKASQLQLPLAMFFYGVSLRHGWGCAKNEPVAFQYIQRAAEHAVLDLNSLSTTVNTSASKGELIMAIYEMGVSFRHGWGCRKNKETAVHFFKIAADLGDADAQNDLGHCYYHGQGIKKDLHLAAKYYRKAEKQGSAIMGNSWIWKKKYDPK